ncbi:MAG: hypothetical protein Q7R50_08250 [Dehalococcoidales bacterium]|nr:hypothetical protein [Dehalococcoidales bacterium]
MPVTVHEISVGEEIVKGKVDISQDNPPKAGSGVHLVYPILTLLAIILNVILGTVIPDQQFVNEPLHSVIEGLGSLAGMSLAVTLLIRHREDTEAAGSRRLTWDDHSRWIS